MLNDQQFSAIAGKLATDGGFTVNPKTGSSPSTGWMMAVPGHESRTPIADTTGSTVKDYVGAKAEQLGKSGMHVGGWRSEDAGQDVLDVSKRYPETPAGHSGARRDAVYGKQEAGFRLSDFHTEYNPFHPAGREASGRAPHELADAAVKNPHFAAKQPEVQAWINSPKRKP
jgi:hypothetical protein